MRARSGASLASAGQTPDGRGSLLRSLFGNLAPVEQRSRLGRPGPTPFMGAFFAGAGFNPASAGPSERKLGLFFLRAFASGGGSQPLKPRFPGFPSDSATGHPWQGTPRFCASAGGLRRGETVLIAGGGRSWGRGGRRGEQAGSRRRRRSARGARRRPGATSSRRGRRRR